MHVIKHQVKGFTTLIAKTQHELATVRCIAGAGSMMEDHAEEYGAAHFLEHMFFKGTEKRDYEDLNLILGRLGQPNAYTSRVKTVYRLNCRATDIREAADMLAEMVFFSSFPEDELEKEKGTIVEEWNSSQDSANSYYYEHAAPSWAGDALHPILGTKESIEGMTRERLMNYRNKNYNKSSLVFAIVGNVDVDECKGILDEVLGNIDFPEGDIPDNLPTKVNLDPLCFAHKTDQALVGLWFPWFGIERSIEQHYGDWVFEDCLGGGMHSLMFDRIREKKGLAYSTGCFPYLLNKAEAMILYAYTSPEKVKECVGEMQSILEDVAKDGFNDGLIYTAKSHTLFDIASGREKVNSLAYSTIDGWFKAKDVYGTEYPNIDTYVREFDKVDSGLMKNLANEMLESGFKPIIMNSEI